MLAAVPTLQGFALLWYWLDPPCRRCMPEGSVVLDALSWASLSGCLLTGAVTFRALAAPRVLRFIPLARLRLLLGVLLGLALLAGLLTLDAALSHEFAPRLLVPSGSLPGTFFGALELMALWVLWGFFVFGRTAWLRWLLVVGAFPGVLLLGMQFRDMARSLDIGVTTEFAVIALVTLLPFVAWYLRARLIDPPDLVGTEWSYFPALHLRPRSTEVLGKSAAAATNTYLLGQPSVPRACWVWACGAVVVSIFWIYLLQFPRHVDPSLAFPFTLGAMFWCGTFFPRQIVRRARMLWIRAGSSRRELFDRAEKLSLGCFAFVSLPLLAIGATGLTHLALDRAAYLLLLATSTGLCCVYGSLLDVRRESLFPPYLLGLVCVTWLFLLPDSPHFLFEQSGPWVALQAPLAELLALPLLRAIAVHRWQRIDWLICKLPKSASQRLRLAR
jgi:hypothetical protein